ncbi:MAG: hypothetical protein ABIR08_07610 [Sphingomonas sp.]
MRFSIPVILFSAMLLSGCWWSGPIFYPPGATATQPIVAGLYEARSADAADKPERVQIARLPNGAWGEKTDQGSWTFFIRLPGTPRDLWIMETIATDSSDAGYGLMERSGDRLTMDPMILCHGTQMIVRAAGGVVENDDPPGTDGSAGRPLSNRIVCRFDDRAALERGLLAYAAAHPKLDGGKLTRIGD